MSVTYSNTNIKNTLSKDELVNPTSIPNCEVWIDFTDFSTLTFNAGNISQADDKSGNNRHAIQATATDQPGYTASGLNGLGAAIFTGLNDDTFMEGSSTGISTSGASTGFVVFSTESNARSQRCFGYGRKSPLTAGRVRSYDVSTVADTSGYRFNNGNRVFNEDIAVDSSYIIIMFNNSGAQYQQHERYVDGVLSTQYSTSSGSSVPNLIDEGYMIGAGLDNNGNPTSEYEGNISEILLYSRNLTDEEKNKLLRRLSKKYNISVTYL